jgi:hypothetical protein
MSSKVTSMSSQYSFDRESGLSRNEVRGAPIAMI